MLGEVIFSSSLNLIPHNFDVFVALRGGLHVIEADGVHELVNDRVKAEAADFQSCAWREVQELFTSSATSDGAGTSTSRSSDGDEIVVQVGIVRDES